MPLGEKDERIALDVLEGDHDSEHDVNVSAREADRDRHGDRDDARDPEAKIWAASGGDCTGNGAPIEPRGATSSNRPQRGAYRKRAQRRIKNVAAAVVGRLPKTFGADLEKVD